MGVLYHDTDGSCSIGDVNPRNLNAAAALMDRLNPEDYGDWDVEALENEGADVLLSARYMGELDISAAEDAKFVGMIGTAELVSVSNGRVTVRTRGRY